jgi:hypothetical protein
MMFSPNLVFEHARRPHRHHEYDRVIFSTSSPKSGYRAEMTSSESGTGLPWNPWRASESTSAWIGEGFAPYETSISGILHSRRRGLDGRVSQSRGKPLRLKRRPRL